jgi:hypothetical protein
VRVCIIRRLEWRKQHTPARTCIMRWSRKVSPCQSDWRVSLCESRRDVPPASVSTQFSVSEIPHPFLSACLALILVPRGSDVAILGSLAEKRSKIVGNGKQRREGPVQPRFLACAPIRSSTFLCRALAPNNRFRTRCYAADQVRIFQIPLSRVPRPFCHKSEVLCSQFSHCTAEGAVSWRFSCLRVGFPLFSTFVILIHSH